MARDRLETKTYSKSHLKGVLRYGFCPKVCHIMSGKAYMFAGNVIERNVYEEKNVPGPTKTVVWNILFKTLIKYVFL